MRNIATCIYSRTLAKIAQIKYLVIVKYLYIFLISLILLSCKSNIATSNNDNCIENIQFKEMFFSNINYIEKNITEGAIKLIEKMDAPEEQKQQLRDMYNVYDSSLDPKKKDSLKLAVDKMLNNAMEKTKNDPQQ